MITICIFIYSCCWRNNKCWYDIVTYCDCLCCCRKVSTIIGNSPCSCNYSGTLTISGNIIILISCNRRCCTVISNICRISGYSWKCIVVTISISVNSNCCRNSKCWSNDISYKNGLIMCSCISAMISYAPCSGNSIIIRTRTGSHNVIVGCCKVKIRTIISNI